MTFTNVQATALNYNGTLGLDPSSTGGTYTVVTELPTNTPVPVSPTSTPIPPTATPAPVLGDADGDNAVTILDYNIWRDEFKGIVATKRADFDRNGTVELADFGIWRNAFEATSNVSPTPTTVSQAFKRVFVTSATYTGNLHGLAGADAECQARADIKNLGGTWKAWLSDRNTSAASRLNHSNNPYKLINGSLVANNWEDLTKGAIANPININELGQVKSTPIWVGAWTSTKSDGSYRLDPFGSQSDCIKWTMNTPSYNGYALGAFTGTNTAINNSWTEGSTDTCNTQHSLYCFEQ